MFLNYGEICIKIKELMDDFQKRSQSTAKVETIADMKVRLVFEIRRFFSQLIEFMNYFLLNKGVCRKLSTVQEIVWHRN